jgi:hypothetical protein
MNLKIKKVIEKKVLSIIIATGFIFVTANSMKAQNAVVDNRLVGRWELCSPDGKRIERPNVRQKVYTKNSYVVLEVDKNASNTYVDFIGTITAESEDKITERVIYTHSHIKHMMSRSFQFFYKIESDYLYLKGIDNAFNEIWVRISD